MDRWAERLTLPALAREAWRLARGPTARKGYMSLVDQAVLSGTSFVTSILLARFCVEKEYGAYVVAIGVMLLLSRLQIALITSPMTVLGAQLGDEEFCEYVSALLVLQVALGIVGAVGVLAAGAVLRAMGSPLVASALAVLAAASVFLQVREFFRRVLFARFEAAPVLLNDVLFCGALLAALVLLWKAGALDSRNVFLALGLVSALAVGVAVLQARRYLARSVRRLRRTLAEQWKFGRYVLIECISSYAHMEVPTFILAGYLGTEAAAQLGAARNILAPLQVALFGIANVAGPRAAAVFHHQGRARMNYFLGKVAAVSVAIFTAYCLCAALAPNLLLRLFYGHRYAAEGLGVRLWAAIYFVLALRQVATLGLSAMRRPDITVGASIASAALTVGLCLWSAYAFAVPGALSARLAGELLCLGLAAFFVLKENVEKFPVVEAGR